MAVEIREMVININIGSLGSGKHSPKPVAQDTNSPKKKKKLIEECAESVLDVINKKNER